MKCAKIAQMTVLSAQTLRAEGVLARMGNERELIGESRRVVLTKDLLSGLALILSINGAWFGDVVFQGCKRDAQFPFDGRDFEDIIIS